MITYSIVIELNDPNDGEDLSARRIENRIGTAIQKFCMENSLDVIHLEASEGSLSQAFGVGESCR